MHPYSSRLLGFLEEVHRAKSYAGVSALERSAGAAHGLRTVFRWHRELGQRLVYFPEVKFSWLGLCHAHVFLEEASALMFRLPYAVEYAWLAPGLGERVLYLHCVVPLEDRESFGYLLKGLQDGGYCRGFSICLTGDGVQVFQGLRSSFTTAGHLTLAGSFEGSWTLPEASGRGLEALAGFPLALPVVFEHYGARLSLNQVWNRVYKRVGQGVWAFFPKRQRKWTVNGKVYVKKALLQLSAEGLFLQNRVVYRPLLQKACEVFLVVKVEREGLEGLAARLSAASVCLQVYPGLNAQAFIRVVGDTDLLYQLLELFPEGMRASVKAFVFDRAATWKQQEEVRFCWELLYDRARNAWAYPKEKLLRWMGVEGYRG